MRPNVRSGEVLGARFIVKGTVQGVGFRPFVYRVAGALGLAGWVRNDPEGVTIEAEGAPEALDRFAVMLSAEAPPLARVESIERSDHPPLGAQGFRIEASGHEGHRVALVSPDMSTCDECRHEILDPSERRAGYPFTNCTNCGPRFTITLDIPYDRPNTTMASFQMCEACRAEYEDPADRRFHAQPIACWDCGPALTLTRTDGGVIHSPDPIGECARMLEAGSILAIKGLGGYHLACDAASEEAVGALRARKVREDKPFALMAPGLEAIRSVCEVSPHEESMLTDPRRPIVLLARLAEPSVPVAASVAPRNRHLGFMLPYTPLHILLMRACGRILVMTSANLSDEPIAYLDGDALSRLGGIADAFLRHNRPIHIRCDDSVARSFRGAPCLIRRSRGYAPEPLLLAHPFEEPILAVGAELKNTFCLASGRHAFVSHHIGDLENYETMRSFEEGVAHYSRIFEITPGVIAHDLHPEYLSTKWAHEAPAGIPLVGVQHHHAHIAACLADNDQSSPVIGLALDGTGWGDDATIWGCEVLVADLASYQRAGHLREVPLPGGAQAIKEPWRMAAVYLNAAYGPDAEALDLPFVHSTASRWAPVLKMARAGINSLPASSAGRLFDAAAALAGLRERVNYEGQAAIEWEQAADPSEELSLPCGVHEEGGSLIIDGVELIHWTAGELARGTPIPRVAAAFHNGLAAALVHACRLVRDQTGLEQVALSGGTFQNLFLLEKVTSGLELAGFTVWRHRRVPANDGGISLGQAVVAAARRRAR